MIEVLMKKDNEFDIYQEDSPYEGGFSHNEHSFDNIKRNYQSTLHRLNNEQDEFNFNSKDEPLYLEHDFGDFFDTLDDDFKEISVDVANFLGDIENITISNSDLDGSIRNRSEDIDSEDDDRIGGYPIIQIVNLREDVTDPLIQELRELSQISLEFESKQGIAQARMIETLIKVTASAAGNSAAYQKALEANSHPVAKSLRKLNRLVITPTLKLASNVLFGFEREKSTEQKILTAVEKQTEFMMRGEVRGRGFFERMYERGVVGSVVGGVANQLGLRHAAQTREDKRARGEEVDERWYTVNGIIGNFIDMASDKDITRRGYNGFGNQQYKEADKSQLQKVSEYTSNKMVDYLIEKYQKELRDSVGFESVPENTIHDVKNADPTSADVESEAKASKDFILDSMTIAMVKNLVIESPITFTGEIDGELSKLKIETIISSKDMESANSISNDLNSFSPNWIIPETDAVFEQSNGYGKEEYGNPYKDQAQEIYDQFSDPNRDKEESDSWQNIHSMDRGIESIRDEYLEKSIELTKEHRRKSDEFAQIIERFNSVTIGELNDISKYTKTTAKETEKVRRQGFLRMLMGFGSAVVSGIGNVISTVASVGASIVAAITALGAGKKLLDVIGDRRRRKRRPPRSKDVPPNKRTAPNSRGMPKLNVKGAGLVGAGLTAFGVHQVLNDEDLSFKEKSEEVGGLVGSTGGGLMGASGGAKLGATIGTFFGPGVGTLVGGAAGSLLGGILGAIVGDTAGSAVGSAVGSTGEFFGADKAQLEDQDIKDGVFDSIVKSMTGESVVDGMQSSNSIIDGGVFDTISSRMLSNNDIVKGVQKSSGGPFDVMSRNVLANIGGDKNGIMSELSDAGIVQNKLTESLISNIKDLTEATKDNSKKLIQSDGVDNAISKINNSINNYNESRGINADGRFNKMSVADIIQRHKMEYGEAATVNGELIGGVKKPKYESFTPTKPTESLISKQEEDISVLDRIRSAEIKSQPLTAKVTDYLTSYVKGFFDDTGSEAQAVAKNTTGEGSGIIDRLRSAEITAQPLSSKIAEIISEPKELHGDADTAGVDSGVLEKVRSAEINAQPLSSKISDFVGSFFDEEEKSPKYNEFTQNFLNASSKEERDRLLGLEYTKIADKTNNFEQGSLMGNLTRDIDPNDLSPVLVQDKIGRLHDLNAGKRERMISEMENPSNDGFFGSVSSKIDQYSSNSGSSVGNQEQADNSSLISSIGSTIKDGITSIMDMFNDEPKVSPYGNVASSIDYSHAFDESASAITKSTEDGNNYLKEINATLKGILKQQKRSDFKETTDDNSSVIDSFTSFLGGNR